MGKGSHKTLAIIHSALKSNKSKDENREMEDVSNDHRSLKLKLNKFIPS